MILPKALENRACEFLLLFTSVTKSLVSCRSGKLHFLLQFWGIDWIVLLHRIWGLNGTLRWELASISVTYLYFFFFVMENTKTWKGGTAACTRQWREQGETVKMMKGDGKKILT